MRVRAPANRAFGLLGLVAHVVAAKTANFRAKILHFGTQICLDWK